MIPSVPGSEPKIGRLSYAVILFVVLISGSLYYSTYFKNLFLAPLLALAAFHFVRGSSLRNLAFKKSHIAYVLAFLLVVCLNPSLSLSSFIVLVLRFLAALLIVACIPIYTFSAILVRLVYWLCLLSLPYIVFLYLGIESPLPPLYSLGDVGYHFENFVFFGINSHNYLYEKFRNSGIFWEPGAFQFFIVLALLLGTAFNQLTRRVSLVFILTLLTTQSTTGYITAALVGLFFLAKRSTLTKAKLYIAASIPVFGLTLFPVVSLVVFKKFSAESSSFVSFLSRYQDHALDWYIFTHNPLIGVGFENRIPREVAGPNLLGIDYYLFNPTGADSLLLFISQVGFLGIFLLIPLLFPKYMRPLGLLSRSIACIIMLILFSTENFLMYIIFNILVLYGLNSPKADTQRKAGIHA